MQLADMWGSFPPAALGAEPSGTPYIKGDDCCKHLEFNLQSALEFAPEVGILSSYLWSVLEFVSEVDI